jgi:hypothetical protein
MLPDLDSSAAAIWASGIRAAVVYVLPDEPDVPHDASSTQIIRQSERNRIKARFLELADLLANEPELDYHDDDPSLTAAERNPSLR